MDKNVFRVEEHVPDIYVSQSRDFQLLARLLTLVINGCKYEAESLKYINNGELCNDRLLIMLAEKAGFFEGAETRSESLRKIVDNFMHVVHKKGSKAGIKECVYLWMKIENITSILLLVVDETNFKVTIGIDTFERDTSLLSTMLKYVLPAGYLADIVFVSSYEVDDDYATKGATIIEKSTTMWKSGYAANRINFLNAGSSNVNEFGVNNTLLRSVNDEAVKEETFGYTGGIDE